MTNWKYTGETREYVHRTNEQGFYESTLSSVLAEGTIIEEPDPVPLPVLKCSKRQGELALLELESPEEGLPSLLHWVESVIDGESDPIEKRKMQAHFNAAEWSSDDAFVAQTWCAAGKTTADLLLLFKHAVTL